MFSMLTVSLNAMEKMNVVHDFELKDYNENLHTLSDFKDSKATVIMFIATRCPVSNAYNERMANLHDAYKDKGIQFVGINSNKQEDIKEIKKHAMENKLNFTILKDHNNIVADKYNASVTPEVYVINSDHELLYHGRIDDDRREKEVKSKDLRNVLDKIVANEDVEFVKTKAFGCTIKRVSK